MRFPGRLRRTPLLLAAVCVGMLAGRPAAHPITIDGDGSDWTGTPGAQVHTIVVSNGEWIYRGEAGDVRNDPAGTIETNMDITEIRLTADTTNLYLLVRFADVALITEPSVGIGIDVDLSAADGSLNFQGDETNLTYGGNGALMPERIVQVHNAVAGTTWVEYFADDGAIWYTPAGTDSFISPANDLLEAQMPLASLLLTPTSTFRFSCASFDNGNTAGTGVTFNNDDDSTVDYGTCDALDCLGGTVGVTQGAFTRDLGDGDLDLFAIVDLGLIVPIELSAFGLE